MPSIGGTTGSYQHISNQTGFAADFLPSWEAGQRPPATEPVQGSSLTLSSLYLISLLPSCKRVRKQCGDRFNEMIFSTGKSA